MENIADAIRNMLSEMRSIQHAVESNGDTMLELLDGRLRGLSSFRLAKLKKQLRDFNPHTGRWMR